MRFARRALPALCIVAYNQGTRYAAGANGVFVGEPTAGILSTRNLDRFSSVYVKRMADAVQDEHFFLILHDCGNVVKAATVLPFAEFLG